MFNSVKEILESDFPFISSEVKLKEKSDRILKSTKIERAILEDLSSECDELFECRKKGKSKLKTFDALVDDVFQAVYGLKARYVPEDEVSTVSKRFNKEILATLMNDEHFTAVKSVCEGKEAPSISATEEFSERLLCNLDELMQKATGGKGKVDAIEKMEESRKSIAENLTKLLSERENVSGELRDAIDRKIVTAANHILSKTQQIDMYENLIERTMRQNNPAVKKILAASVQSALDKATEVSNALLAWSDDIGDMQNTPLNMQVVKRVASSPKLRYIATFLGRYKEMLNAKRLSGYTYGRGEKYDIEYGNSISKALTSELALLSTKELMPLFIRKYQSKSLKQYRKREHLKKGKGDIIVCLDESGSAFGEKNAYGMAIAMVLYEICRINNTNFVLIHFASDIKCDYFPKEAQFDGERLMACAETFLNGGTNYEKPLEEVMSLYESGKLDKPDIVFITDGLCDIKPEFEERFNKFKNDTGTKLTGVLLDKGECFEFSLQKFADEIYRTSLLVEDEITERIIEERI